LLLHSNNSNNTHRHKIAEIMQWIARSLKYSIK